MNELETAGVFSRVGGADLPGDVAALIPATVATGTILSRKMLPDQIKREVKRRNGAMGGNPKLRRSRKAGAEPVKQEVKEPDNHSVKQVVNRDDKPRDKRPEARDQTLPFLRNGADDGTDRTSGNGALNEPQPGSDKKWLFDRGLPWLAGRAEKPEGRMRPLIGKWLKELKDDATALRRIFEAAASRNLAEPIGWITKAVEGRAKEPPPEPFEQTDEMGWRKRLASYLENGIWPPKWGGGGPGDHSGHPPWMVQLASQTSTTSTAGAQDMGLFDQLG